MCIILQNVKISPNPHLCSNFQENKIFKIYACNNLITSPEQFIVMCHQLFGNGLTVYQLWLAFTKVPKCFTKKLKHSLQLGNPSFLKDILTYYSADVCLWNPGKYARLACHPEYTHARLTFTATCTWNNMLYTYIIYIKHIHLTYYHILPWH